MGADKIQFETILDMFDVYGEPCSNCIYSEDNCYCHKNHRQKTVLVSCGHIPEIKVRRKGGCPDHKIKEGDWWGEDPIRPGTTGDYGGSRTSIL